MAMVMRSVVVLGLLLVTWVGCKGPAILDGQVACDPTGLCPPGFQCAADGRCHRDPGECGNGVIDPGETCDPSELCQTNCADNNSCTLAATVGDQSLCTFTCLFQTISDCGLADGCCPESCIGMPEIDPDCSSSCGNNQVDVDEGETCDGNCDQIACATSACEVGSTTGDPSLCNVECIINEIVTCSADSDGCCPPGCSSVTDADCSATCDGGEVDEGETCDGNCPKTEADCEGTPAMCFRWEVEGSAENCNAECLQQPVLCADNDGCCSAGCTLSNDNDCVGTCGNGLVETGETCEPSIPRGDVGACPELVDCELLQVDQPPMDPNCVKWTTEGTPGQCDVTCVYTIITQIVNGDGCCPDSGTASNDTDCLQVQDGGMSSVDAGEDCTDGGTTSANGTGCMNMPP